MEIRLKERLVGAMVLVLAGVIFIPMVLDGPNGNQRVSRSVVLPNPASTDARRTVRLDLDVDAPMESSRGADETVVVDLVPAQEQRVEVAAMPESGTSTAKDVAIESPSRSAGEKAPPVTNMPWTVQAGSFSSGENAEGLAARMREFGYPAYVSQYDDGKRTRYRVRVGGFPSRDAAQRKAEEIRSKTGEPATPVQSH